MAAAPPPTVRKEFSLSLKVHEAKELSVDSTHGCDPYVSILINHHEESRTKTIWNNKEPVWDQDYFFDLQPSFSVLTLVVWDENRKVKDIPLGKVTLSKDFLSKKKTGTEQWMQLASADTEGTVTGDLHLEVSYYRPTSEIPLHTFSINVLSARNLVPRDSNGLSDPYVVLHILPDADAETTRHTKVATKTLNPEYNENITFTFDVSKNIEDFVIHASVWDWDRFTDHEFMGHLSIPISDVLEKENLSKWFPLLPSPASIKMPGTVEGVEGKLISMIKPMMKRHSRKGSLHAPSANKNLANDVSKAKTFIRSLQALPSDHTSRIDKPRGSIRVFYSFSEERILPEEEYKDLLEVISEEKYLLSSLLGKWSPNREDAARTIIKIFDYQNKAREFLAGVIEQEVMSTVDPNTLFRGNSMASKGLDIYMKLTAMPFLQKSLQTVIRDIVTSKKPCEVDPTRLDKSDDLQKNWRNLIALCDNTFNAIVGQVNECPQNLCEVLAAVRDCVKRKFPDSEFVEYTAVSGFIFLRFLCPAILGPTLFGLWDENIEKSESRTLTLIAKTLQNLGNLVEFGYKEAYMKDMNPFIIERLDKAKAYIDQLSLPSHRNPEAKLGTLNHELDFAKLCARLYQHLEDCRLRIVENALEHEKPLVEKLLKVLDQITAKLQQEDEKIKMKKEQDRINRRSAASAMSNSEGKVILKSLPQGPSSLAALDSLLDDLENFNAQGGTVGSRKERPPPLQMLGEGSTKRSSKLLSFLPRSPRSTKSPSRPGSLLAPNSDSSASSPVPSPRSSTASPFSATVAEPAPAPAPAVPPSASPLASPQSLPQSQPQPQPEPAVETQSSAGSNRQNVLNSLDDLLNDLTSVVISEAASPPEPAPAPVPVPVPVAAVPENKGRMDLNAIFAQANSTSNRVSASFEKNPSPSLESAPEPPKDDSTAIDDLLDDLDQAATEKIQVHLDQNACVYCSNEVSEKNFHTWAGLKWHSNHFRCSVCDTNLEGSKFFFHEEKLFCVDDYYSAFACSACGLHISDQMSEVFGKKYHAACFCCCICEEPLTGNFRMDDEGNLYCKQDWLQKNGMICATCNELIPGDFISIGNDKYHTDCFKCSECGLSMAGREYIIQDNKFQCASHFRCAACQGFLDGQVVVALGKRYHVGHFSCAQCKKSLVGEPFYEKNGSPWCGPCHNQAIMG